MSVPAMTHRIDPPAPLQPPAAELPAGDWLPEAQGHRVWWCEGGAADGLPVLIVHGGPGGASRLEPTRWFEGLPVRWIAIDQRGCGRSMPRGATAHNDLTALLHDMDRLRRQLGLDRWGLAGGSWGARVALASAQAQPGAASGLFIRSPFLGGLDETRRYVARWSDWLGDEGRDWAGAAASEALAALYRTATPVFNNGAPSVVLAERLAQAWASFDDAQAVPGGVAASGARFDAARLPKAEDAWAAWQVHAHYAARSWGATEGFAAGWPLNEGSGIVDVGSGPVSIVWGDADATCDPAVARALVSRLPGAVAREVPGVGHRMTDPQLGAALREAARVWVRAMQETQKSE